jgi:hypothetical protein
MFKSMPFTLFFEHLLKKYFIVLGNILKILNKNPEDNPDLPMDFKNLGREPKVSRLLSNLCDCQKEI